LLFARRSEIEALSCKLARGRPGPLRPSAFANGVTNERGKAVMTPRFPRTEAMIPEELLVRLIENGRTSEEREGFDLS